MYNRSIEEQQTRLAVEEVYHNLAIEASKIQEKTKVVTRYIEKPDGTKITEKTEEENKVVENTKVIEESADKSIIETKGSTKALSKYSLMVLGPLKYGAAYDYEQTGIYAGLRLFGSPIELILGGRPFEKSIEGGLRIEW